jgi:hypothetical protein
MDVAQLGDGLDRGRSSLHAEVMSQIVRYSQVDNASGCIRFCNSLKIKRPKVTLPATMDARPGRFPAFG